MAELSLADGGMLAYHKVQPTRDQAPLVVFCHGFMSNQHGAKALYVEDLCRKQGWGCVRFDCFGHGDSSGDFTDGTIGRWRQDVLAVLDHLCDRPVILIGSSMGAWLAILAAMANPAKVVAFVGLAAAPDFTEDLLWQPASPAMKQALLEQGKYCHDNCTGGDPYIITRQLIEEARSHLVMRSPIHISVPIRLIHGMADTDVPWQLSVALAKNITGSDCQLRLIKDGDHRLSRDQDLQVLGKTLSDLC